MSTIAPKDKALLDIKLVQECMDMQAKRMSIAFLNWAIESGNIIGDNYGDTFIPDPETEETLYNKFIESITK